MITLWVGQNSDHFSGVITWCWKKGRQTPIAYVHHNILVSKKCNRYPWRKKIFSVLHDIALIGDEMIKSSQYVMDLCISRRFGSKRPTNLEFWTNTILYQKSNLVRFSTFFKHWKENLDFVEEVTLFPLTLRKLRTCSVQLNFMKMSVKSALRWRES